MIRKEDLEFYGPNGSIAIIMDAMTNKNLPDKRVLAHTPLELLKIVDYKSKDDYHVLAKAYKIMDFELPQQNMVFHSSEITVDLPHHLNRLIDLYFEHEKEDYAV